MTLKKKKLKNLSFGAIALLLVVLIIVVAAPSILSSQTNLPEKIFEKNQDLVSYIDYSARTSFQNEKNVLFFKANWCGTCTVADKNFLDDLKNIPEYLTIYRADYEKEVALKQKYGVTYQHTFVQVDNKGNELKQWAGSYTINEVLSELV